MRCPTSSPENLSVLGLVNSDVNPYIGTTQSQNLRTIESALNPVYKAKNDIVEFNTDWNVTPALTITSQSAFNHDFLWSAEDYNRFTTAPGIFLYPKATGSPDPVGRKPHIRTEAYSAIRNWDAATASWQRICRTNMPGN